MSYRDIYMRRVPRSETGIPITLVLLLHLLQMAESMMATYRQSTQITEYRIQVSVHQKSRILHWTDSWLVSSRNLAIDVLSDLKNIRWSGGLWFIILVWSRSAIRGIRNLIGASVVIEIVQPQSNHLTIIMRISRFFGIMYPGLSICRCCDRPSPDPVLSHPSHGNVTAMESRVRRSLLEWRGIHSRTWFGTFRSCWSYKTSNPAFSSWRSTIL